MAGFACITMHTRVHIVKVRHGRQHNSSRNSWGVTRTPCQPPVYPQQRSTLFSSCHGGGQTRPMPTRATSGEISSFVCSDDTTNQRFKIPPFCVSRPRYLRLPATAVPRIHVDDIAVENRYGIGWSPFFLLHDRPKELTLVASHQARSRDL